jgi:signal transduction histidine kinase
MPPPFTETPDDTQASGVEGIGREWDRLVVETVERDRLRIAAALHNSACQSLSGLQLLAATLLKKKAAGPESSGESIDEFAGVLRQVSRELREVIQWLRPPSMREQGLIVSLLELGEEISRAIPCEFRCDDRRMELDPYVAGQLFQIAHAVALAVVRRGAATRIEIALAADRQNGLTLSVWDDENFPERSGPACEPDLCDWELLRLRARAIGGKLTVRSPESGGTRVTCDLESI